MPNTHLRSLLTKARESVRENGSISLDTVTDLLSIGVDAGHYERRYRKEFSYE